MNGAESLIRTLLDRGVEVCFANPGTSELHLVEALDRVGGMRAVLALFEGVCTGAADGYGRMTERPAMTLLHLGPGLGNGIANLHNARRAGTPIVNVVGDHASYHLGLDAPLSSDIEGLARTVSRWTRSDSTSSTLARDGSEAVSAALTPGSSSSGQIATLIVPADASWGEAPLTPEAAPAPPARAAVSAEAVRQAVQQLDSGSMLLLNGRGLSREGLVAANRIASVSGCRVTLTTFPARLESGPGRPAFDRLPYFPEGVRDAMQGVRKLFLAGAEEPVSFFAYPGLPGRLVPRGCEVFRLARREEDIVGALEAVAEAVKAPGDAGERNPLAVPDMPRGEFTTTTAAAIIGNLLPEDSIVCVDSGGGHVAFEVARVSVPHTWLSITGGAIGQGVPVSTGAAIAAPDRKVLSLAGDGGAMYTIQALWTQAREGLDVTTVIYSNRAYWILGFEYEHLGIETAGETAASLFDIGNPDIGWTDLARSLGVPGGVAETNEDFADELRRGFAESGPYLIEARIPGRQF